MISGSGKEGRSHLNKREELASHSGDASIMTESLFVTAGFHE